ncbi:MAG: multidrug efflux RND transporter permease subunit [Acidobacteriota bacterium]
MRFGRFFIDRPRFAVVLSLLIVLLGGLAYARLPVSQYPEIAPPSIVLQASYPGATPEVIAESVAAPLEQAINGIENMLYMTSSSTADGLLALQITFEIGTDLDDAQILVQNRAALAEPRLPEEVRRTGLRVEKRSSNLMMVVHLLSPDQQLDEVYVSNYALLRVVDVVRRIEGVGELVIFGAREYSMRIWLDPDRLAALDLNADDVVGALQAQNVQITAGAIGAPPLASPTARQLSITARGRFSDAESFENVVIKTGDDGRLTRVRDVARVELGALEYSLNSYIDGTPALGIGIFQRPGSNALETASEIRGTMAALAEDFPPGLDFRIAYDPTQFVEESIAAVYRTIFEATLLVVLVILVFLRSWRAALVPIAAIPVSLIGTFAVMAATGVSLNTLSLFGLVLAIGIVVDDAIVVVENVERNLALGLPPREATARTMTEVGTALIAMALVLGAVFVPTAFLGGITGEFFRQFALTIAVATLISAFNSLTLSPALCAWLLRHRSHDDGEGDDDEAAPRRGLLTRLGDGFDRVFDALSARYARVVGFLVRRAALPFLVFILLLAATAWMLQRVPRGLIPQQDQGYLIVAGQLPAGASLARTDAISRQIDDTLRTIPGVRNVVSIVGFSGATFATASNATGLFVALPPFDERPPGLTATVLAERIQQALMPIREGIFFVIEPPPVTGLGVGGGFKMAVQDRSNLGLELLGASSWGLIGAANQTPGLMQVFTTFSTQTPRFALDIDRTRAQMLDVAPSRIFEALRIQLGSAYVNDFTLLGRTYRVTAQADGPFRNAPEDVLDLRVPSRGGAMVPLGSFARISRTTGTDRVVRHNLFPAVEIQGGAAPGVSTRQAMDLMESLAATHLPPGIGYEWTEVAYQEAQSSGAGLNLFGLSVLFVFLLLAAQYESWSLPLAIILIVPLSMLFGLLGVMLRGMDNNVLTQIGLVVLIGLASKNAILIVEFAKQQEDRGLDRFEAAIEAARLRLRPILMTAFAFILGVVPLVIAQGAGAEMRRVLGTVVFSGMLGVTFAGLLLTPVFYVVIRRFVGGRDHATQPDDDASGDREPPAGDVGPPPPPPTEDLYDTRPRPADAWTADPEPEVVR